MSSNDDSELSWIAIRVLQNLYEWCLKLDGSLPTVALVDGRNRLIAELRKEAERWGEPLTEFEEWALIHGTAEFTDEMRAAVLHLNNRTMAMIRHRIGCQGSPQCIPVQRSSWYCN